MTPCQLYPTAVITSSPDALLSFGDLSNILNFYHAQGLLVVPWRIKKTFQNVPKPQTQRKH